VPDTSTGSTFSTNPADYITDTASASVGSTGTVTQTPGAFGDTIPGAVTGNLPPDTSVISVPGTGTYQTIDNSGQASIVNNQGQTILNNDQINAGYTVVGSDRFTNLGITPVDTTIAPGTGVVLGTGGISVGVAGQTYNEATFVQTSTGDVVRIPGLLTDNTVTTGSTIPYGGEPGGTGTVGAIGGSDATTTPTIGGLLGTGTSDSTATTAPVFGTGSTPTPFEVENGLVTPYGIIGTGTYTAPGPNLDNVTFVDLTGSTGTTGSTGSTGSTGGTTGSTGSTGSTGGTTGSTGSDSVVTGPVVPTGGDTGSTGGDTSSTASTVTGPVVPTSGDTGAVSDIGVTSTTSTTPSISWCMPG
jgi:hypothetical protein